jgi:hypothetical protein
VQFGKFQLAKHVREVTLVSDQPQIAQSKLQDECYPGAKTDDHSFQDKDVGKSVGLATKTYLKTKLTGDTKV